MNPGIRTVLAVSLLASLGACAGSGGSPAPSSGNREIITLAEIQDNQSATALDLVQELRPRWTIRNRGSRTFEDTGADFPSIVLDNFPPREFDFLREIPRDALLEVQFLSPREATFLYGTGYNAGVIKVTTKR